jgi:hypothetical protein
MKGVLLRAMEHERGIERHKFPCGGTAYHEKLVNGGGWRYVCLLCNAPGPEGVDSFEALAKWNQEQRA